ncbi:hypothetical protein GOA58_24215 [Sinorhizobium meliloti]|uniref:hypothetical protein n=1 Tax=Rhizobium meliloti TaxID=382 RepID=UPI0012FE0ECA|nr:hypothetical protein [Sinorhizobium meliloti]MCK3785471.1 hypothetical protein [Sinorhizobium meliloti]MCK3791597.1 hypothetical protein [Sinorhizobium meliloti]MCK3797273.1 hypothetical protein [Sinorhizobium meliloti]MDW9450717.1 hypothetical protein [Sinorhizobium meliloti]MDW9663703.1 hypothetical protein [Sinorhizobium meliloti]
MAHLAFDAGNKKLIRVVFEACAFDPVEQGHFSWSNASPVFRTDRSVAGARSPSCSKR